MRDIGSSLIILIIALVLLWLAVTDKLPRVLRAYDVLRGKEDEDSRLVSNPPAAQPNTVLSLPSLPMLSLYSSQVPA